MIASVTTVTLQIPSIPQKDGTIKIVPTSITNVRINEIKVHNLPSFMPTKNAELKILNPQIRNDKEYNLIARFVTSNNVISYYVTTRGVFHQTMKYTSLLYRIKFFVSLSLIPLRIQVQASIPLVLL